MTDVPLRSLPEPTLDFIADLFAGRYVVRASLPWSGRIPMFRVDGQQGRRALGVLPIDLEEHSDLLEHFSQLISDARSFEHPGALTISDFGVHQGVTYFELNWEHSARTLWESVGESPLAPELALELAGHMLETLEAALDAGLHHWNLSASDVLLIDRRGHISTKMMGFGMGQLLRDACIRASSGAALRFRPQGLGSSANRFLPPELEVPAAPVDHRSDLYSIGALLHFMLIGRPPSGAFGDAALHRSPGIQHLISHAMAPEIESRFQTIADMRRALTLSHAQSPGGEPARAAPSRAAPSRASPATGDSSGFDGISPIRSSEVSALEASSAIGSGSDVPELRTPGSIKSSSRTFLWFSFVGGVFLLLFLGVALFGATPTRVGAGTQFASESKPLEALSARESRAGEFPAGADGSKRIEPAATEVSLETEAVESGDDPAELELLPVSDLGPRVQAFAKRIEQGHRPDRHEMAPLVLRAEASNADPRLSFLLARAFMNRRWYMDAVGR
ncbi:MAG: hypothetical protein AAF550_08270, partial [Myxococcota bacterium]